MARKARRVTKAKTNIDKSKNAKCNTYKRKRETFIRKFQEAVESYNDTYNSSDFDHSPQIRSNVPASSSRDSTFIKSETNSHDDEDIMYSNFKCYRCEHFSKIPPNLPQSFCKRVPVIIGQCKIRVSFLDAITMLKSATVHVLQIPIDKLRRIFNEQWNKRDKCDYFKKRRIDDVKQSSLVTEDLPARKKNSSTLLYYQNLSDISDASKDASALQALYELQSNSKDENSKDESLASIRSTSPVEPLIQERYTSWRNMKNKASSPTSDIILNFEAESFCSSFSFESLSDVFNEKPEHRNECIEEDSFFSQGRYADNQNERESIPDTISSIESFNNFPLTPTSSRHNLIDLAFDYSPTSQLLTQISQMTIFQADVTTHQRDANNSQADLMQLSFSNESLEFQIDDNDMLRDTGMENGTEDIEYDNACSTSHISTLNFDSVLNDDNQRTPSDSNSEHRYKLRNLNKRNTCTLIDYANAVEEVIWCSLTIGSRKTSSINNKRSPLKNQSSLKRHKSTERTKTPSKKKEESKEEISANWLNFTLDCLNLEQVMFESLKVILSILCDERTAEEYATHGWWKGTLEEEAVNAVSTLSDIFKMKKMPNICNKEIITAINRTLNKITTCVQLNKTTVWTYRIRIILELCNSLSVCVAVIDHLTAKLEPLRSTLSEATTSQQVDQLHFSITMNQAYFIFYAFDIALRKYRTVVSSGRETEDVITIPYVADLWKARYVDEELEDAERLINVDAAEKRWINALKNLKNCFEPFTTKSVSLLNILLL